MTQPTDNEREERPAIGIFTPSLLDQCISCGFCLPACPTYSMTHSEGASPRGRITLMRALETGLVDARDDEIHAQASMCLGCRACEPVCPAGVQYGTLLEEWRTYLWKGTRPPLVVRGLTWLVRRRWLLTLLGLLAGAAATRGRDGPHLMLGCVERFLFPNVSRAARSVFPELDARSGQGCCGALHAHNGNLDEGRDMATRLGQQLPGRIVTTSGGCAAHLAAQLGRGRVAELSEYLTTSHPEVLEGLGQIRVGDRLARVTLQDSCHLRNGLGIWREPRTVLARIADFVELEDAASCCGGAGTYSLLRRKESTAILDQKLDRIAQLNVDYVVAVNPGCLRQLQSGLRHRKSSVEAIHIGQALTMATTTPR